MSRILLQKLDRNLLLILSLFLLAFIPLYPKIPLGELIPGYQVRLRLEDLFVGLTGLVWLREVVLNRVKWRSLMLLAVVTYAVVGMVSLIFAVAILHTIPFELLHIGKSGLHYFRYLEYFALFFFLFSSIKTKKHLQLVLRVLSLTLIGIIIYAVGQIYWEWPVYSTMNREYSKGVALTLGEFARVHSTFGGHYDLAAYLVLVLPLFYAFFLNEINWKRKIFFSLLLGAGGLLMLETQAKTSVIGLAVGGVVVSCLWFFQQEKKLRQKIAGYGLLAFISVLILSLGTWFVLPDALQQKLITKLETNAYGQVVLGYFNKSKEKPSDVQHDLPEYRMVATTSATGQTTYTQVVGERQWSENALKYGLSMGIRLDTLWPQALRGWANNLTLGNGYATLNKQENAQFTEADSTDNNYLRVIGELGILGFISFFSMVMIVARQAIKQYTTSEPLIASLSLGFLGATAGLLVNALYIDVFAASKVAFTYWSLAGIVYAAGYLQHHEVRIQNEAARVQKIYTFLKNHLGLFISWCLLLLLNPANPYAEKSFLLNLETAPANLAYIFEAMGQAPLTSFYSFYLKPWYALLGHQLSFYYANIFLGLSTLWLIYLALRRMKLSPRIQAVLLVSAVLLLTLYQSLLQPRPLNVWITLLSILFYALTWALRKIKLPLTIHPQWVAVGLGLAVLITLFTRPFKMTTWLNQFRHTTLPEKHQTVKRANLYFSAPEFAGAAPVAYWTTLRPEYVSLFRTQNYQPYTLDANLVKNENDVRQKLNQGRVFLNDYGLASIANPTLQAFNKLFSLKMVALDCEDRCNLYEVQPDQPIISPTPVTFTNRTLTLPKEFTFTLITQQFDIELKSTFTTLASVNKLSEQNWTNQSFIIFTGDVTHKADSSQLEVFTEGFTDQLPIPLVYLPGNYDTAPLKVTTGPNQHFFNQETYFLLFNGGTDQEFIESERLYWYNRLLEIEKLEEVKNVIIVMTDVSSNDAFLDQQLLPRMEALSDKNFTIFLTTSIEETTSTPLKANVTLVELANPLGDFNAIRVKVEKGEVTILPEF